MIITKKKYSTFIPEFLFTSLKQTDVMKTVNPDQKSMLNVVRIDADRYL